MSIISEQIKQLKEEAKYLEKDQEKRLASILRQAADTIEALSTKLAAENMERSDRYCGGGWIAVDENNLPQGEVLGCNAKGGMAVGKIKKVREGDIRVADFLGGGLMDCIAYMPLPDPYRP